MLVKDNFTETHLLFTEPVHFTIYEQNTNNFSPPDWEFFLNLPTIGIFYFNDNFKQLVGLLNAPVSKLQEQFVIIKNFQTHFQLLEGLALIQNPVTNHYLDIVCKSLSLLNINVTIEKQQWDRLCINGHPINEQLFERIRQIILMSLALKKHSDFTIDPVMREMQERIDRIKNNNKPINNNATNGDFTNAFIILTYEFGYKPSEIYNMTQYTANLILGYTNNSIKYKLSLIAAGNGNTKKVNFITDKRRK